MSQLTLCDICEKEVGIRWFELKKIHREMDYGMKLDSGTHEVCSKACLLKLMDKIKEFTIKDKSED